MTISKGEIIMGMLVLIACFAVLYPIDDSKTHCGIDTCIYYNDTEYYDWCDGYYGNGSWYIGTAKTGLGGMFLHNPKSEKLDGEEYICNFRRNDT